MLRLDRGHVVGHLNYAARADEFVRVDLVHAAGSVDEMVRGVDVRCGVDTHRNLRNVRGAARGHRLCGDKIYRRVAGVDRGPVADGDGHIVDLHYFIRSYFVLRSLIGFAAAGLPLATQRGFSSVPRFKYFCVKNPGFGPGAAVSRQLRSQYLSATGTSHSFV